MFFELCKRRGYFGKSQIIRENREKRLFEHYKKFWAPKIVFRWDFRPI